MKLWNTATPRYTADAPRETGDFEVIWECPNCGQSYFGKNPPELCDYCEDFTTWQRVR